MNFETLVDTITPRLRQLAGKYNAYCSYVGEDDLYSEMVLFLWKEWKNEKLSDKTESYIVQSCYFHIRNYLRTSGTGSSCIPLDDGRDSVEDEDRFTLKEVIPDNSINVADYLESRALIDAVEGLSLKEVEKTIFKMLYEGYTAREIGGSMGMSHTMVNKHKKNILDKVSKEYSSLLVVL